MCVCVCVRVCVCACVCVCVCRQFKAEADKQAPDSVLLCC